MTGQTSLGARYPTLAMAALAVGHFFPIARPQSNARHRVSPNVAAVAADAVLLEGPQLVRLTVRSVAAFTGQFRDLYVLDMREADVIRLPRIHAPLRLPIRRHIRIDKVLLRGGG